MKQWKEYNVERKVPFPYLQMKPSLWERIKNRKKYFIFTKCDNCGLMNKAGVPKGIRIVEGVTVVCDNCGVEFKIDKYQTAWTK